MQKKPFLKPLVLTILVFIAAFALLAAAIAGAPQKSAPKTRSAKKSTDVQAARVRTGAVYTPVSLATNEASVLSDGSTTPELTLGVSDGDVTFRVLSNVPPRYKRISLKKRPAGALTTPPDAIFHLQVYEVTFEVGSRKLKLKAITNGDVRKAWKYLYNGTFTKWPNDDKGIAIQVSSVDEIKRTIKYVGGAPGINKNYLFVASSDTTTIEDLFASTIIHVKE